MAYNWNTLNINSFHENIALYRFDSCTFIFATAKKEMNWLHI